MTTATAPRVSREILEERWHAATTKPKTFQLPDGQRDTGLDNTDDFYEFEEAVVKIATRLRGDGLSTEELEEVEDRIAANIWGETLKARLMEWAEEHAR